MTTQQQQALVIANAVRISNAYLQRCLYGFPQKEALSIIADILDCETLPYGMGRARIQPFLHLSVWRIYQKKIDSWFVSLGIFATNKRFDELTPRQRCELADLLRT